LAFERPQAVGGQTLRRIPRLLVVLAIALFLALLAYGLSVKAPNDNVDQRLSEGKSAPAPGFSLAVVELGTLPPGLTRQVGAAARDGKIGLGELRGVPTVINLWASWCSPCRAEATVLERGWRRYGRSGVLFLGLDIQDLTDDARAFLGKEHVTYPTIRDPGKDVARDYGATGIPETYFVSARGRVVGHVIGVVSPQQIDVGVAAARSGRVAGKKEGGARRKTR
jgi:cytochrome c biogenesis protein CcmG/thiol:disulfide interchange protein DsbE